MTHRSAFRGFGGSPLKSHYSKDEKTKNALQSKGYVYGHMETTNHPTQGLPSSGGRASSSSGKIKGFSQHSNIDNSAFRKSLVKLTQMDMHSQKDFTIEERLNEESFVSKTNLRDDSKTIELANNTNENYR